MRGIHAIQTHDLQRSHRTRLVATGYLQQVMKGWYIASRPDEPAGESTAWFANYWKFCSAYLESRFGENWIITPEQSLLLHVGKWTVPDQLIVRVTAKARNRAQPLPHGTSLLDVKLPLPAGNSRVLLDQLRVYTLPAALCAVGADFFTRYPGEARAALGTIRDASEVLAPLLEGGHTTVAGRLAGAFRNIGRQDIADQIIETFKRGGHDTRELDPFDERLQIQPKHIAVSPYSTRLRMDWHEMRKVVLAQFPEAPGLPNDLSKYLRTVDDAYTSDAYHSLSIEGYSVTEALIKRVRAGNWNPTREKDDTTDQDRLAARGYYQAFQSVRRSVIAVLGQANPGGVAQVQHREWYQELFGPSVLAGILKETELAGYRRHAVYIRKSRHVPPPFNAVYDVMTTLFELLAEEQEPAVRVVLGHFAFVYIHPYMDGNGRMGRFLMNLLLAAGGYPWTVVPVTSRAEYMAALESASSEGDIAPFTQFLANLVRRGLAGEPAPLPGA